MTVESAPFINSLNATLPAGGDPKAEGDDHIRLLKSAIKASFPNVTGAVNAGHADMAAMGDGSGSVTLGTGYSALGIGLAFCRRSIDGFVSLSFDLTGSVTSSSSSIMTLPAGYRPVHDMCFVGSGVNGAGTSGWVLYKIVAATGVVSRLDGSVDPIGASSRAFGGITFPTR